MQLNYITETNLQLITQFKCMYSDNHVYTGKPETDPLAHIHIYKCTKCSFKLNLLRMRAFYNFA